MKKPVMTDNIEVLTHSSIRIICTYGTIYIDPYQVREMFNDADYIFVTMTIMTIIPLRTSEK